MPSANTQFKSGQLRHPNAGRKRGTPNKRSSAINNALADFIAQQLPDYFTMYERIKKYDPDIRGFNAMTRLIALHLRTQGAPQTPDDEDETFSPDTQTAAPADPDMAQAQRQIITALHARPDLYHDARERQGMMRAIRQTDMASAHLYREDVINDPDDLDDSDDEDLDDLDNDDLAEDDLNDEEVDML